MRLQVIAAHALSVVGHPAALAPLALAVATTQQSGQVPTSVLAAAAIAGAVMTFSAVQVMRGRWVDSDASQNSERAQLNLFLVAALSSGCAYAWFTGQAQAAIGLGLASAIVVVALLLRRSLKLSLHVAFATFAAAFFWPDWRSIGAMLVLTVAIGWARVALHRHTRTEVMAGALTGACAGAILVWLAVGTR